MAPRPPGGSRKWQLDRARNPNYMNKHREKALREALLLLASTVFTENRLITAKQLKQRKRLLDSVTRLFPNG